MITASYCSLSLLVNSLKKDIILFERVTEFLSINDVLKLRCICKTFINVLDQAPNVENQLSLRNKQWEDLSLKEGVPLVEGNCRDRQSDYEILKPITLSGERINKTLGTVHGQIPCISTEIFRKLNTPDPFNMQEQKKLMKENWVFVVVPDKIGRIVGPKTPLNFEHEGNLVKVSEDNIQHGKELVIPFSLKNLAVLCSFPLKGEENMPVFGHGSDSLDQFDENFATTRVYFMRKYPLEDSYRKIKYAKQERQVRTQGYDTTSLRIRALFDAILILESGFCPDHREPMCKSTHCITERGNYVNIGGFAKDLGVVIRGHDQAQSMDGCAGVVPCISATISSRGKFT